MSKCAVIALVVALGTVCQANPVILPLNGLEGIVPPDLQHVVTFPVNMADVDSISLRVVGTLTAGLGLFWEESEPRPYRNWPEFILSVDGLSGSWGAKIRLPVDGPIDLVIPFRHWTLGPESLAGVTAPMTCGIWHQTLWDVYVSSSAEITHVELWLWYDDTVSLENRTWSLVKSLYR